MSKRARSSSGRLGGAAVGCLLAVAVLVAAALPATAGAAPAHYTYEVCDPALPGGNTPEAHFTVNPGIAFVGANTCAEAGGGLSITETGHVSSSLAFWNVPVAVPPGGFAESVTVTGKACGLGAGNDHTFVFEQGWPPSCGETQRVFQSGAQGPFGLGIFLNCDGNFKAGCEAGPTVFAHYIVAQEIDPVPPQLAGLGGSLLSGGVIRGNNDLSVDASDDGGGLSRVSVAVNGLPAAEPDVPNCSLAQVDNPSFRGVVATTITPCPSTRHSTWTLDTENFPFHDGENSVQVCASDYASLADPNTTCTQVQHITVDNSCSSSAVPGGEQIDAHFVQTKGNAVTVPYGEAAKVTGALTDNAGDAIRGATICVQTQMQGSASGLQPLATTRTDAQGHFTYRLPAGPNRKVMIGYRHDRLEVARSVRYFAHAQPTLRLNHRRVMAGGRVRIAGRVPGPAAGGRVVVLQASAPGSSRWFTFNRATTNRRGIFRSRYRFDATTATTTYRIRAAVPRQAGYPYQAGHSKPARIKVTVGREAPDRRGVVALTLGRAPRFRLQPFLQSWW